MESVFASRDAASFAELQAQAAQVTLDFDAYIQYLQTSLAVEELPRAVVFTTADIATHSVSDLPLPAYTNDYRIVFCPDISVWRTLLSRQLDDLDISPDKRAEIEKYYRMEYGIAHVRQILGHELVHQSAYFPGDFDDDADAGCLWFEEGMAEYISRRYFLSPDEYTRAAEIGSTFIALRDNDRIAPSLENFTYGTYADASIGRIFYWYWRSFFAVEKIVDRYQGDLCAVFSSLDAWDKTKSTTASRWFGLA